MQGRLSLNRAWNAGWTQRSALLLGALVLGTLIFFLKGTLHEQVISRGIDACAQTSQEIDCLYGVIKKEMQGRGIRSAMKAFGRAYEASDVFVASGCHRHAHQVGDMAYFEVSRGIYNLKGIDFPPETAACSLGFYHGFLGHLFQDNHDPSFVVQTCRALIERLQPIIPDIKDACFHAVGHGLVLSAIEEVPNSSAGDVDRIIEEPIAFCESISGIESADRLSCKEGVLNVVTDWASDMRFGLSLDSTNPFSFCRDMRPDVREICMLEVSRKLSQVVGPDMRAIERLVRSHFGTSSAETAFRRGVGGFMTAYMRVPAGLHELLIVCNGIISEYRKVCIRAVAHVLAENSLAGREIDLPVSFCEQDMDADLQRACWGMVAKKLRRFYSPSDQLAHCALFPTDMRDLCQVATDKDAPK